MASSEHDYPPDPISDDQTFPQNELSALTVMANDIRYLKQINAESNKRLYDLKIAIYQLCLVVIFVGLYLGGTFDTVSGWFSS